MRKMPLWGGRGCSLFSGISELFADVLEGEYDPALLLKVTRTEATNGDISEGEDGHPCFIHEVARSEAYRRAAGLADDQVEVIILAAHLKDIEVDTDDRLSSGNKFWSVVRAKIDGAKSQWKVVCKELKNG